LYKKREAFGQRPHAGGKPTGVKAENVLISSTAQAVCEKKPCGDSRNIALIHLAVYSLPVNTSERLKCQAEAADLPMSESFMSESFIGNDVLLN